MNAAAITKAQVLDLIPQQSPFRFIDDIEELSENGIVGRYTFKHDECFYTGHLPGNPITPGVILLEVMAQIGVVALGYYLTVLESSVEEAKRITTFFAEAEGVEFRKPVYPGETITVKGEKIYWRRRKIKSKIQAVNSNGEVVACATLAGIEVKK